MIDAFSPAISFLLSHLKSQDYLQLEFPPDFHEKSKDEQDIIVRKFMQHVRRLLTPLRLMNIPILPNPKYNELEFSHAYQQLYFRYHKYAEDCLKRAYPDSVFDINCPAPDPFLASAAQEGPTLPKHPRAAHLADRSRLVQALNDKDPMECEGYVHTLTQCLDFILHIS